MTIERRLIDDYREKEHVVWFMGSEAGVAKSMVGVTGADPTIRLSS
jgi:hypothetical protein